VTLGLDGSAASGFVCRDGRHVAVVAGRAVLADTASPLAQLRLDVELADGERLSVEARAVHRLPVIRARGSAPVRVEFAACRLAEERAPAGWCEVAGL